MTVTEAPPNITGNALAYKTGDETPVITLVDSGIRAITADQKSASDTGALVAKGPPNMVTFSNIAFAKDFEGGANGAAVTTANTGLSDGSNGTTDGTMTFSTAAAVRGTRSMKISNPIGATNLWRDVASPSVVYRRMYFRMKIHRPAPTQLWMPETVPPHKEIFSC